jgi:hypothetical protein
MIGSRFDFALLAEACSPFTPTLGRGRNLTAMASSSTPKSTSEERFAELFPLLAEENARLRRLFQPSGVIVEGVSHLEHDPPPKWGTVWSQRRRLLPTEAAVLEPPPKKAAVLEPPPKAMTGGQWLGPPPPETVEAKEAPAEWLQTAAETKIAPPDSPHSKINATMGFMDNAFPGKYVVAPPGLPPPSKAAVAKMLGAITYIGWAAPPGLPPPVGLPPPPSKASVAKVTFAPGPAPRNGPSPAYAAYFRRRFPTAPGSHLMVPSSSVNCPGLPYDSLLELCCRERVSTYTAQRGWNSKCLTLVFPPMELFTRVPAAVATIEADRYFFIAGGIGAARWQDSRNFIALKLPAERHAVNYAMREMHRLIDAQQFTTSRALLREASVATTQIDPYSDSEPETGTETEDLAESHVAESQAEAVVRRGDLWDDAGWFARASLGREPLGIDISAHYDLLVRQRDFHNQMRLRMPFRRWAAAANILYTYPDGDASHLFELERYRAARWYLATGTLGMLPSQPAWQHMQMSRGPHGAAVAQGQFLWHASARFRFRAMMGAWAAVAIEAGAMRRALRLAHNPLSREGRLGLGLVASLEIQRFLGLAPWQTA